MRWTWSPQNPNQPLDEDEEAKRRKVEWTTSLSRTDWRHYTEPRNLIHPIALAGTILLLADVYKRFLRRVPSAPYIKPQWFRKRSVFGTVVKVGDGDNFRLFHTPGGRLAGWGWLPWRHVPSSPKKLVDGTIHIRLAGVDAPEAAHFGRPAQPFSGEALQWLTDYILHRRVRAYLHRPDQYQRAVASVFVRKGLFKRDVSLEMLRAGMATIYEAKFGSEFGNKEAQYREAERIAKSRGIGIWAKPGLLGKWLGKQEATETPREYKTRMSGREQQIGKAG